MTEFERRPTAILAADVVHSRLMAANEKGTYTGLEALRRGRPAQRRDFRQSEPWRGASSRITESPWLPLRVLVV